jgi:hypothetical protein
VFAVCIGVWCALRLFSSARYPAHYPDMSSRALAPMRSKRSASATDKRNAADSSTNHTSEASDAPVQEGTTHTDSEPSARDSDTTPLAKVVNQLFCAPERFSRLRIIPVSDIIYGDLIRLWSQRACRSTGLNMSEYKQMLPCPSPTHLLFPTLARKYCPALEF